MKQHHRKHLRFHQQWLKMTPETAESNETVKHSSCSKAQTAGACGVLAAVARHHCHCVNVACLEAGRHRRGSTVEQVHASTQRSKTGDGKKKKKKISCGFTCMTKIKSITQNLNKVLRLIAVPSIALPVLEYIYDIAPLLLNPFCNLKNLNEGKRSVTF